MATLTVCIGNSDDKLSQADWAAYWSATGAALRDYVEHVHGEFLSAPSSPWQNACWVAEGELTEELRSVLAGLAQVYRQDSIAVAVGSTELVGGG